MSYVPEANVTPETQVRLSSETNDMDAPSYRCDAWVDMQPYWQMCQDVKAGREAIIAKRITYLPKFDSESLGNYDARCKMTFPENHYAQTLEDLSGLVFSQDPKLGADVPSAIKTLLENADGRGTKWTVFARDLLETGLDDGHAVLLTEYPTVPDPSRLDLSDFQAGKLRPYWNIIRVENVLSWITENVGGVEVVIQVDIEEQHTERKGLFGTLTEAKWRVYKQDVITQAGPDGEDVAVGLGAIRWELWERYEYEEDGAKKSRYDIVDSGEIKGPKRIPIRVVYCGEKLGTLHTRPFLLGMAYSNLEETQVKSDYAAIMHKCNVPTPIFIGREEGNQQGQPVQMGNGVDIPKGGDAKMLEPTGSALNATRSRLQDIQGQIRRQGATLHIDDQKMTATEAAIAARQRNARLLKAAQSLKDTLEGGLEDMAAFLNLPKGGEVIVNTNFSEGNFNPIFLAACRDAYGVGALPLESYLHVLAHGKLPDDFDAEDAALKLYLAQRAKADAGNPNDPNGTTPGIAPPGSPDAGARMGEPVGRGSGGSAGQGY